MQPSVPWPESTFDRCMRARVAVGDIFTKAISREYERERESEEQKRAIEQRRFEAKAAEEKKKNRFTFSSSQEAHVAAVKKTDVAAEAKMLKRLELDCACSVKMREALQSLQHDVVKVVQNLADGMPTFSEDDEKMEEPTIKTSLLPNNLASGKDATGSDNTALLVQFEKRARLLQGKLYDFKSKCHHQQTHLEALKALCQRKDRVIDEIRETLYHEVCLLKETHLRGPNFATEFSTLFDYVKLIQGDEPQSFAQEETLRLLRKDHSTELARVQTSFSQQLKKKDEVISGLENKIVELKEEMENPPEDSPILAASKSFSNTANKQFEVLKGEIGHRQKIIEGLKEEISDKVEEIRRTKVQVDNYRDQLQQVSMEAEQLAETKNREILIKTNLTKELEGRIKMLEKSGAAEQKSEKKMNEVISDKFEMGKEIKSLKATVAGLEKSNKDLQETVERVSKDNQNLIDGRENQQAMMQQVYQKQIRQLEDSLADAEHKALDQLERKNSSVSEITEMTNEIRRVNADVSKLNKINAALEADLVNYQSRVLSSGDVNAQEQFINTLESDLRHKIGELQDLSTELKERNKHVDELSKELNFLKENSSKDSHMLFDELHQATSERDKLKDEVCTMHSDLEQLLKEKEHLSLQVEALTNENQDLQEQKQEMGTAALPTFPYSPVQALPQQKKLSKAEEPPNVEKVRTQSPVEVAEQPEEAPRESKKVAAKKSASKQGSPTGTSKSGGSRVSIVTGSDNVSAVGVKENELKAQIADLQKKLQLEMKQKEELLKQLAGKGGKVSQPKVVPSSDNNETVPIVVQEVQPDVIVHGVDQELRNAYEAELRHEIESLKAELEQSNVDVEELKKELRSEKRRCAEMEEERKNAVVSYSPLLDQAVASILVSGSSYLKHVPTITAMCQAEEHQCTNFTTRQDRGQLTILAGFENGNSALQCITEAIELAQKIGDGDILGIQAALHYGACCAEDNICYGPVPMRAVALANLAQPNTVILTDSVLEHLEDYDAHLPPFVSHWTTLDCLVDHISIPVQCRAIDQGYSEIPESLIVPAEEKRSFTDPLPLLSPSAKYQYDYFLKVQNSRIRNAVHPVALDIPDAPQQVDNITASTRSVHSNVGEVPVSVHSGDFISSVVEQVQPQPTLSSPLTVEEQPTICVKEYRNRFVQCTLLTDPVKGSPSVDGEKTVSTASSSKSTKPKSSKESDRVQQSTKESLKVHDDSHDGAKTAQTTSPPIVEEKKKVTAPPPSQEEIIVPHDSVSLDLPPQDKQVQAAFLCRSVSTQTAVDAVSSHVDGVHTVGAHSPRISTPFLHDHLPQLETSPVKQLRRGFSAHRKIVRQMRLVDTPPNAQEVDLCVGTRREAEEEYQEMPRPHSAMPTHHPPRQSSHTPLARPSTSKTVNKVVEARKTATLVQGLGDKSKVLMIGYQNGGGALQSATNWNRYPVRGQIEGQSLLVTSSSPERQPHSTNVGALEVSDPTETPSPWASKPQTGGENVFPMSHHTPEFSVAQVPRPQTPQQLIAASLPTTIDTRQHVKDIFLGGGLSAANRGVREKINRGVDVNKFMSTYGEDMVRKQPSHVLRKNASVKGKPS